MSGLNTSRKSCPPAHCRENKESPVIHKGVEYSVIATADPEVWEWRFQIGGTVKTGRTQTKLAALAARRVQGKIDAVLRGAKSPPPNAER
jgi:hypothetical protein